MNKPHVKVEDALANYEYTIRLHSDTDRPIRSPQDFADALGIDICQITKTLFLRSHDRKKYALVTCSSKSRLKMSRVAQLLDCKKVELCSRNELAEKIGYPPTGVTPLGTSDIFVFIDESIIRFETVLVGGGAVGVEIEIDPNILKNICDGVVADFVE